MKLFTLGIGLLFVATVNAAPINDPAGTKLLCEKAAEAFGSGDVVRSFDILKPHWPLPIEEITNLVYQTETQLKMVSSRFGPMLGHDYIDTEKAGSSFIKHTFIGKFEKHAVRFVCVFYKPKERWVVNAVHWDDQTALLFN